MSQDSLNNYPRNNPSGHPFWENGLEADVAAVLPQMQAGEISVSPVRDDLAAQQLLKMGDQHYAQYKVRAHNSDLVKALQYYRKALEVEPTMGLGYVRLASALWASGEITLDTAVHYCDLALKFNPQSSEPHAALGLLWRQAGEYEKATQHFEFAIRQAPMQSAQSRMSLGLTQVQQALKHTEWSSWKRLSATANGLCSFASGCLFLPIDKPAFSMFQQAVSSDLFVYSVIRSSKCLNAVGLHRMNQSVLEWASIKMPEEPVFFHTLGDLLSQRGNIDASVYFYNRALELNPTNGSLHRKLGHAYSHFEDFPNAIKSFEKAVEVEPEDFDTRYKLAQMASDRENYMKALYYYKEAAGLKPDYPYVYSNMAYVLFKLEDINGAIRSYQKAIALGEDDLWTATVAQTLGTIYQQVQQNNEAAIEMFQIACRLDPANMEARMILADLYFDQGQPQAALDLYQKVLLHYPDNTDCYNYVGYLLWQMDRNPEAITAYLKAIELDGTNAIAYNNLGVIYLDEEAQHLRALVMFQKALELNPNYTLACFNLARTQEGLGQTTDAAKTYARSLSLNENNSDPKPELSNDEILERINGLFRVF